MIMRFRGVHGWLHCRSWWWLVIPLGGMRGVLNLEGFNTRGNIVWCIGFLICLCGRGFLGAWGVGFGSMYTIAAWSWLLRTFRMVMLEYFMLLLCIIVCG